jgi:hypothetical protein
VLAACTGQTELVRLTACVLRDSRFARSRMLRSNQVRDDIHQVEGQGVSAPAGRNSVNCQVSTMYLLIAPVHANHGVAQAIWICPVISPASLISSSMVPIVKYLLPGAEWADPDWQSVIATMTQLAGDLASVRRVNATRCSVLVSLRCTTSCVPKCCFPCCEGAMSVMGESTTWMKHLQTCQSRPRPCPAAQTPGRRTSHATS